jgi:hypothetical protein
MTPFLAAEFTEPNKQAGPELGDAAPALSLSLEDLGAARYEENTGSLDDVPPLLLASALAPGAAQGSCLYDLFAVVIHEGSAHSGHYHALIRDEFESSVDAKRDPGLPLRAFQTQTALAGKWFDFNDRTVRRIDPRKIAGQYDGVGAGAYLLFYQRRGLNSVRVALPASVRSYVCTRELALAAERKRHDDAKNLVHVRLWSAPPAAAAPLEPALAAGPAPAQSQKMSGKFSVSIPCAALGEPLTLQVRNFSCRRRTPGVLRVWSALGGLGGCRSTCAGPLPSFVPPSPLASCKHAARPTRCWPSRRARGAWPAFT